MNIVRLYTGDGEGKTSAALGVALRALGHGKKVVMIQFLKGRKNIGEYKIQKKLKDFRVYQFGKVNFINLREPSKEDIKLAKKGLDFAVKVAKKKPFLLILDEINIATNFGLLKEREVINALKKMPKGVNVIMTGRYAAKSFVKLADLAMEVNELKRKSIKARTGIEF